MSDFQNAPMRRYPSICQEYKQIPLVSISDDQRKHIGEEVNDEIKPNFIRTIHNGIPIDLYQFVEKPMPADGKKPYLAFLGRFAEFKGPDLAIKIAVKSGTRLKIAAKFPHVETDEWNFYDSKIKPMIEKNKHLVEYVGEINDAQKNDFLGNALALIFPIYWPEPFGLVAIEAMACGTPVLSRRKGALPEIIEEGISGLFFDTVEEGVKKVEMIKTINRFEVRKVFERKYTAEKMAEEYEKLFYEIAEKDEKICGDVRISEMRIFGFSDATKNYDETLEILIADKDKDHGNVSQIFLGYLNKSTRFLMENCVAVKLIKREEGNRGPMKNNFQTIEAIKEYVAEHGQKKPKYIIDILHHGKTADFDVIVMELAGGSHRKMWIPKDFIGNLGEQIVQEEAKKFLRPLEEFHKMAQIHGDIKRDNFVYVGSILKLIDFDASQQLPKHLQNANDHELSNHMIVAFWPDRWSIYHAPEFRKDEQTNPERKISPKIDIWSAGIIIIELFLWQPKNGLSEKSLYAILRQIADIFGHYRWIATQEYFISIMGNKKELLKIPQKLTFDAEWLREYSQAFRLILQVRMEHPKTFLLINNMLKADPLKRLTAIGALNFLGDKCRPTNSTPTDIAGISGLNTLLKNADYQKLLEMFENGNEQMKLFHRQIDHLKPCEF